jgi:hypothetical protein
MKTTHAAFFLLLQSSMAAAQVDLTVDCGSLPGSLRMRMGPYGVPLATYVILSQNIGPTPLSIIDARDPRVLRVGTELLGLLPGGFFGLNGYFELGPIALPNNPSLIDRALFFQGISFPGTQYLIEHVTSPRAAWFAPPARFRDRRVQFFTPRAFFHAIPIDAGQWIIPGGGAGALLAQIATRTSEIYDPMTDSWSPGPDMTTARSVHTATRLNDGRWLLVAGVDHLNDPQANAEVFDPVALTFTATPPLANMRMGHSATLLPNGRVLVAGGLSDMNSNVTPLDPIFSALRTTEIYDPVTGTWTNGPSMQLPRAGHAALPLPGGRVLFAGGVGYQLIFPQIWTQTEIYDPSTNTITPGPSMRGPRAIFPVTEISPGRFLCAGGIASISLANPGTPTNQAEIFDSATNTWTLVGPMTQARGMTGGVFDLGGGRFLHMGGAEGSVLAPVSLASTEVFDMAQNAFTPGPTMVVSRAAFAGFAAPTGQYHLIGGGIGNNAGVTNTTEWYYR